VPESNVTCTYCGKSFYKKPCQIKSRPVHYCSRDCFNMEVRTRIECICTQCGKKIEKVPSQIKKSKSGNHFCSQSCANAHNNSLYRSGENHPNWNGGYGSYRERALKEYGSCCQNKKCSMGNVKEEMLDVHHIDGDRGNNAIDNLVVLCVWCHALLTRGLATKENFDL